jgi:hypothetical protein
MALNVVKGTAKMFNFYSKKNRKILSTGIIILLVLALTVPVVLGFLY